VQDGVIPRTRLAEVLRRIDELAAEYGLQVANVFHAGDGNLHPLVCFDAAHPGEPERAEELAGEIVRACVDAGGSITGEHGVGVDKKAHMPAMFSESDLDAFQRLRCAFYPLGLANPGKVMPTPRLCGACSASSIPISTRRAPTRSPPRASRCSSPAGPAAAGRSSSTPVTRRRRSPGRGRPWRRSPASITWSSTPPGAARR